ncbi:MAG: hypothetical protein U0795_22590 [Pirellulales bacterium]
MFPTVFVVLLLITGLSAAGITAIAVAHSRLPRSIQPPLILLPLVALWTAQAVEAAIALLIESVIVYATIRRSASSRLEEPQRSPADISDPSNESAVINGRSPYRVSLLVVFEFLSLAAIVMALATQISDMGSTAWVTIVAIGICSGIAVLSGWWLTQPTGNWKRRLPASLAITLSAATLLAFSDRFLDNDSWPPRGGSWFRSSPVPIWWLILPTISTLVAVWCGTMRRATERAIDSPTTASIDNRSSWQPVTRAGMLILGAFTFGPPLITLIWLNLPSQLIQNQPHLIDNYLRVLTLARSVSESPIGPQLHDWETVSPPELESAHAAIGDTIVAAREAIAQPAAAPLDAGRDLLDIGLMRDLTRGFMLDGRFALNRQAPDEACRSFLDGVRTGFVARSQGLLVDGLIGIACTYTGAEMIYRHRHEFSTATLRSTWQELQHHLEKREPVERFIDRDRRWSWPQASWTERIQMLEETILAQPIFGETTFHRAWQRESARLKLLITELALVAYHREHGAWPDSLKQLVPNYLPAVPADPWSADGDPLHYSVRPEGYLLYSFGPDRIDNGGPLYRPDDPVDEDSGDIYLEEEFPVPAPPDSNLESSESVPVDSTGTVSDVPHDDDPITP